MSKDMKKRGFKFFGTTIGYAHLQASGFINDHLTGCICRKVHRLSIGIDSETARLVFTSKQGEGVAATVVDLGNRFRLIVNVVDCIKSKKLPKLPVASALWIPQPNLEVGAGAWILAGGTHHTSFSYDLTTEYWEDYAEIAGIEMVVIDKNTTIPEFKKELRMNEVYYMLNKALC